MIYDRLEEVGIWKGRFPQVEDVALAMDLHGKSILSPFRDVRAHNGLDANTLAHGGLERHGLIG